jgi:hypothetical protein
VVAGDGHFSTTGWRESPSAPGLRSLPCSIHETAAEGAKPQAKPAAPPMQVYCSHRWGRRFRPAVSPARSACGPYAFSHKGPSHRLESVLPVAKPRAAQKMGCLTRGFQADCCLTNYVQEIAGRYTGLAAMASAVIVVPPSPERSGISPRHPSIAARGWPGPRPMTADRRASPGRAQSGTPGSARLG